MMAKLTKPTIDVVMNVDGKQVINIHDMEENYIFSGIIEWVDVPLPVDGIQKAAIHLIHED